MMAVAAQPWSAKPRGKACLAFWNLLEKIDPSVQCERRFPWLFVPRSDERNALEQHVFTELQNHCRQARHQNDIKRNCDPELLFSDSSIRGASRSLQVDFFLPSLNVAIEFDERQHFTEERKITLLAYGDLNLHFDHHRWVSLCSPTIQDTDPPCRDWIRAFRDSVRDIRTAENGIKLFRVCYSDFSDENCAKPHAVKSLQEAIS